MDSLWIGFACRVTRSSLAFITWPIKPNRLRIGLISGDLDGGLGEGFPHDLLCDTGANP
jgi:hypothetical protein